VCKRTFFSGIHDARIGEELPLLRCVEHKWRQQQAAKAAHIFGDERVGYEDDESWNSLSL
jgi:hypothetical protein